jgi:hypothetical protein
MRKENGDTFREAQGEGKEQDDKAQRDGHRELKHGGQRYHGKNNRGRGPIRIYNLGCETQ